MGATCYADWLTAVKSSNAVLTSDRAAKKLADEIAVILKKRTDEYVGFKRAVKAVDQRRKEYFMLMKAVIAEIDLVGKKMAKAKVKRKHKKDVPKAIKVIHKFRDEMKDDVYSLSDVEMRVCSGGSKITKVIDDWKGDVLKPIWKTMKGESAVWSVLTENKTLKYLWKLVVAYRKVEVAAGDRAGHNAQKDRQSAFFGVKAKQLKSKLVTWKKTHKTSARSAEPLIRALDGIDRKIRQGLA